MESLVENNDASSTNNITKFERREEEKTELQEGAIIEEKMSAENSDYDSADSYSDTEQDVKIRSRASDLDEQSHSDTGSIVLERQEGDGQESAPNKKVDDDEDKKNPQYIPKKGTFYEHDDRTVDEENVEVESEKEKEGKKKVWQDKKERWSHDKFNDMDQAPKSKAELVAIYGYDIRNEEGPPRARRRRRYGRGPNKYTRTWEDEDAYNKAPTSIKTKKQSKPKSTEDFPPLISEQKQNTPDNAVQERQQSTVNQSTPENNRPLTENYSGTEKNRRSDINYNNRKTQERVDSTKENNRYNASTSSQQLPDNRNYQNISVSNHIKDTHNNKNASQRNTSGRVVKPRKELESEHRGFTTKTRQLRPVKNEKQKVLPPRIHQSREITPSKSKSIEKDTSGSIQELEKDINKLTINGVYKGNKGNNQQNNQQRQGSVPPRLQNEQKGSKRYSSMRQRSLPEANTPPAVQSYQHGGYYPAEYNQPSETPGPAQSLIHQAASIHHTTSQVPQIPPQTIPIPQQVTPVTAAPILQAQFTQAFPQAPPAAFLQQAVAAPAYIPPQPPQIINYVQGQPAFTPNYQGFQQQYNPVHELLYSSDTHFSPTITTEQLQTPQTELYQPQGGITYYSTDQQITQRSVPQKRPKAAIPIVAPPLDDKKPAVVEPQHVIQDRIEISELTELQQ